MIRTIRISKVWLGGLLLAGAFIGCGLLATSAHAQTPGNCSTGNDLSNLTISADGSTVANSSATSGYQGVATFTLTNPGPCDANAVTVHIDVNSIDTILLSPTVSSGNVTTDNEGNLIWTVDLNQAKPETETLSVVVQTTSAGTANQLTGTIVSDASHDLLSGAANSTSIGFALPPVGGLGQLTVQPLANAVGLHTFADATFDRKRNKIVRSVAGQRIALTNVGDGPLTTQIQLKRTEDINGTQAVPLDKTKDHLTVSTGTFDPTTQIWTVTDLPAGAVAYLDVRPELADNRNSETISANVVGGTAASARAKAHPAFSFGDFLSGAAAITQTIGVPLMNAAAQGAVAGLFASGASIGHTANIATALRIRVVSDQPTQNFFELFGPGGKLIGRSDDMTFSVDHILTLTPVNGTSAQFSKVMAAVARLHKEAAHKGASAAGFLDVLGKVVPGAAALAGYTLTQAGYSTAGSYVSNAVPLLSFLTSGLNS